MAEIWEIKMKTLVKIALIASLLTFGQMHVSEQLQMRGRQLSFLRNLPHRYLGMLYWSWMLQPHRNDLLAHYGIEWNKAVRDRGSLLEGMTRPVIPILIARESPHDENLRLLSKFLLQEELKDMEKTK